MAALFRASCRTILPRPASPRPRGSQTDAGYARSGRVRSRALPERAVAGTGRRPASAPQPHAPPRRRGGHDRERADEQAGTARTTLHRPAGAEQQHRRLVADRAPDGEQGHVARRQRAGVPASSSRRDEQAHEDSGDDPDRVGPRWSPIVRPKSGVSIRSVGTPVTTADTSRRRAAASAQRRAGQSLSWASARLHAREAYATRSAAPGQIVSLRARPPSGQTCARGAGAVSGCLLRDGRYAKDLSARSITSGLESSRAAARATRASRSRRSPPRAPSRPAGVERRRHLDAVEAAEVEPGQ